MLSNLFGDGDVYSSNFVTTFMNPRSGGIFSGVVRVQMGFAASPVSSALQQLTKQTLTVDVNDAKQPFYFCLIIRSAANRQARAVIDDICQHCQLSGIIVVVAVTPGVLSLARAASLPLLTSAGRGGNIGLASEHLI